MILLTNNENGEEQVNHIQQQLQQTAALTNAQHRITAVCFHPLSLLRFPPTPSPLHCMLSNNREFNVRMKHAKCHIDSLYYNRLGHLNLHSVHFHSRISLTFFIRGKLYYTVHIYLKESVLAFTYSTV